MSWGEVHGGEGRDPWADYDEEIDYAGDALYCGPHEEIQDIILLHNVIVSFEFYVEDFRRHERSKAVNVADWEQDSPFAELTSIKLSKTEVRE